MSEQTTDQQIDQQANDEQGLTDQQSLTDQQGSPD